MKYIVNQEEGKVVAVLEDHIPISNAECLAAMLHGNSGVKHTALVELPQDIRENSMDMLCADIELEDVLVWADAVHGGLATEYSDRISEEEACVASAIRRVSIHKTAG